MMSFTCEAKSVNERYSSFLTQNGIIHFFRPTKLDRFNGIDNFNYDMTYLSKKDSITINCSIDLKDNHLVHLFKIQNGIQEITGDDTYMMFRDVTKKGYRIRLSSRFPIREIVELFVSNQPLTFCIETTQNITLSATYTPSHWKKENKIMTRILQSITTYNF